MTKEEKLRVLEKAEEKCFTCLEGIHVEDMPSGRVGDLLAHISALQYASDCLKYPDREGVTITVDGDAGGGGHDAADVGEDSAEPVPAETAAEAPETEEDAPAEEAETGGAAYDLDEIRVTLNRLHRAGKINVAEIFETMGYRTLSDIPESEYGRLMQLAGVE